MRTLDEIKIQISNTESNISHFEEMIRLEKEKLRLLWAVEVKAEMGLV